MPNIMFIAEKNDVFSEEKINFLTKLCTEICTDILKAKRENIHISYILSRIGFGHPILVNIDCRQETFRTSEVMHEFLARLDAAIQEKTGMTARLRCFEYPAAFIHARN